MANLIPMPRMQFFDANGDPLSYGKLHTYVGGSASTPLATYTDQGGGTPNANPVILDSGGWANVWLSNSNYKLFLTDQNDVEIWTVDNVTAAVSYTNIQAVIAAAVPALLSEWILSSLTPTYISATQFSVTGNQTATFNAGRRIKATVTAGTIYGTITAAAFTTVTTITVAWDSTQLDSGLSAAYYALLSASNRSVPYANIGQDTIASAATCDLGTKTQAVLNLTGTVTITSFGNSMPIGTSKILKVVSAGLNITASTNMVLSAGFLAGSARSYLSAAGDRLKVNCEGTSGGNNVYFVEIISIDGTAYQSNSAQTDSLKNFTFIPNTGAPNTSIDVVDCDSIILSTNGDNNQVGAKTARSLRLTNATLANVNTLTSGLGGLDTGSLAINKDYYLYCVSDGTLFSYVWSLNTNFPDNTAFPTYIYAARCGWNHSNGSGHFWQLQKVNYEYTFCNSGNNIPIIASGSNAGVPTATQLTNGSTIGYVSPECQRVSLAMESVTGSTTVSVAANNTAPIPFYIAQPATPVAQRAFVQLMLESAYVYYGSNDGSGNLRLVAFEDVH